MKGYTLNRLRGKRGMTNSVGNKEPREGERHREASRTEDLRIVPDVGIYSYAFPILGSRRIHISSSRSCSISAHTLFIMDHRDDEERDVWPIWDATPMAPGSATQPKSGSLPNRG